MNWLITFAGWLVIAVMAGTFARVAWWAFFLWGPL